MREEQVAKIWSFVIGLEDDNWHPLDECTALHQHGANRQAYLSARLKRLADALPDGKQKRQAVRLLEEMNGEL